MKRNLVAIAAVIGGITSGGNAQASMVAGWDFSQYFTDGALSIDGATFTNTLSANYSNLDPTFNAGAESAAFGTMYIDGQFGSTAVPIGSGAEQFVPSNALFGSLVSNIDAPVQNFGDNAFDSFTALVAEGQLFANPFVMTATDTVSVTFAADRGLAPPAGGNWILSFGGRTFSGTSLVGIDFSTSGSGFGSVASLELTEADTSYSVDLGPATGSTAFVRFRFDPVFPDQPIIDNVAISVPEAGGLASGVAALLGLFACRRRRA